MSYEFEATDDLEVGAATCAGCGEVTSVDDMWPASPAGRSS
jgi:hypothetical protein